MLHDLRLIVTFIRAAIQQETALRANFFINLLGTVLDFVAGISGMLILFSQVKTLQGWAFPQALAFLGVYQLIGALRTLFIGPSLETLGGQFGEIFAGSFDLTLLKPVHTQFLVRPHAAPGTIEDENGRGAACCARSWDSLFSDQTSCRARHHRG